MKKLIGLALFLAVLYGALLLADPSAGSARNHFNLAKTIGLFGILCLAVTPVIITGGIDLSIGAVVGFCVTSLAMLLTDYHWNPHLAVATVLVMGIVIGWINGTLVTKLGLQPFVVTLCGLFIYRGLSRWIANDGIKGLGGTNAFDDYKAVFHDGDLFGIPKFFVIFLVLAAILAVILHLSIYGRYWLAIGANEKTAHYSGIRVDRYKILAYVFCSLLCAIFSVLYLTEYNSAAPSETGNFFELYAIAGAVLGGVSLRGGEGTVIGVIIGTAVMRVLYNAINILGIPTHLEFAIIGTVILAGVIADELVKRIATRRRAARALSGERV